MQTAPVMADQSHQALNQDKEKGATVAGRHELQLLSSNFRSKVIKSQHKKLDDWTY